MQMFLAFASRWSRRSAAILRVRKSRFLKMRLKKWQQKCLFWVRVRVRVMVRVRVRVRVMVRVRVKVRVRVRVRAGPPLGPPRTEVELSGRTEVELCLRVGPQN